VPIGAERRKRAKGACLSAGRGGRRGRGGGSRVVTGWLAGWLADWLLESSFDSIFISRFNSISPQLSRSLGRRSASRIASRATRGRRRGWPGWKIGKRAAGCSCWMQGAALKTTVSHHSPPATLSLSSPSRRGDKTNRCTEAGPLYRRRPSANLLFPP